jgi:hypothetical protein
LIDTNIEEIELEVSEFKDKALYKHGVVESTLSLVIFEFSSENSYFAESNVHHDGENCLHN